MTKFNFYTWRRLLNQVVFATILSVFASNAIAADEVIDLTITQANGPLVVNDDWNFTYTAGSQLRLNIASRHLDITGQTFMKWAVTTPPALDISDGSTANFLEMDDSFIASGDWTISAIFGSGELVVFFDTAEHIHQIQFLNSDGLIPAGDYVLVETSSAGINVGTWDTTPVNPLSIFFSAVLLLLLIGSANKRLLISA